MKKNISLVFIAGLVITLFIVFVEKNNVIPNFLFWYDESDYMYAVEQGFLSNYLDLKAISFITFVQKGIKSGSKKSNWSSLSKFIRSSNDITFYRHYHAPLYFYYLIGANKLAGTNEYSIRWATLFLLLCCSIILFIGIRFLLKNTNWLTVFYASIALLFSPGAIVTGSQLSPHALYMIFVAATLILFAKFLCTKAIKYWYLSIALFSLATITLEYAPFLFITIVVCSVLNRKALFNGWQKNQYLKMLLISLGIFTGVLFTLWPGGIFKLSILKNYLFFAYFVIQRGKSYGNESFFDVWFMRIKESPVEYIIIIFTLVFIVKNIKRLRIAQPFLIYIILVLAAMISNKSPLPQYISSLFPPAYILSAIMIHTVTKEKQTDFVRVYLPLGLTICLFVNSFIFFSKTASKSKQVFRDGITHIERLQDLHGKYGLATFVPRILMPALHYYLKKASIIPYSGNEKKSNTLLSKIKTKLDKKKGSILIPASNMDAHFKNEFEQRFSILSVDTVYLSDYYNRMLFYEIQPTNCIR